MLKVFSSFLLPNSGFAVFIVFLGAVFSHWPQKKVHTGVTCENASLYQARNEDFSKDLCWQFLLPVGGEVEEWTILLLKHEEKASVTL